METLVLDKALVEKHFARLGARVQIVPPRSRFRPQFGIDIATDARGEYFIVEVPPAERLELLPLEVRPDLRHLLLLARRDAGNAIVKDKYVCGHDERHWFVAGVQSEATSVKAALESLRPNGLNHLLDNRVKTKNRLRRKNAVFVRQGEWFFVPQPDLDVPASLVLRREPLSRGLGSKPHWCEEVYRNGGQTVYVCSHYLQGVSSQEYFRILESTPNAKHWGWRAMQRDARVYARGKVSHPDHKTIGLPFWHEVLMNGEHRRGVVFLD